jgi:uroporphyrinogen-III synthase
MQPAEQIILSTAHVDDAFITEAREKGVQVDVIPFIITEEIQTEALHRLINDLASQHKKIVFTSQHAVKAVINKLAHQPSWNIYCLENKTRSLVSGFFGPGAIIETAADATELAGKIKADNEEEVVFFCGDQRRDELPEFLHKKNIPVREIKVYKTIGTPVEVKVQYDAILFFSPSAVNAFFERNQVQPSTILFAIGNTTYKTLSNKTTSKIVIADRPDKQYLLNQAVEYLKNKKGNLL